MWVMSFKIIEMVPFDRPCIYDFLLVSTKISVPWALLSCLPSHPAFYAFENVVHAFLTHLCYFFY